MLLISVVVLLILSVVAGAIWYTPENRIKYLMWRGNYHKARKVIEPFLEENPHKLHLYRHLAEIYFFEKRRDKKALRVFETILRLKIPFQWKSEILPLVAKYYISQGRTDSEAIEIIERAVEKELLKLKR